MIYFNVILFEIHDNVAFRLSDSLCNSLAFQ